MNELSEKYLQLAEKNAEGYINNPNVAAVVVTGSAAKGYADEYSDVDNLVILNDRMSRDEFDKIVENAKAEGGDLYHGTPEEGFAVYKYIEGIKFDYGFGLKAEQEELIDNMLNNPEPDDIKQLIISGFCESYIISGHNWVNEWKSKALNYPEQLAALMVKKYLHFHPKWVLVKMGLERNDNLFLYEDFVKAAEGIFAVMCAVNRMYYPGKLKGAWYYMEQMKYKPDSLREKLDLLFSVGRDHAVEILSLLAKDTFDLIDKHIPEFSTERTRKIFDMELRH
jgi:predicted nucleotidyltransferase